MTLKGGKDNGYKSHLRVPSIRLAEFLALPPGQFVHPEDQGRIVLTTVNGKH